MVREDQPGDKRLVAYVVPQEGALTTITGLREFLLKTLPAFMIPALFVEIAALPLTPNGKVDYQALPRHDYAQSVVSETFVAPRTPIEKSLAVIWESALSLQNKIGVNDNFFDLGGHSLKMVEVFSGIRRRFGLDLPLTALFEAPTIAQLAAKIVNGQQKHVRNIAKIQSGKPTQTPIFFIHTIDGFIKVLWHIATSFDDEQPVYAIQGAGLDGECEFYRSIEDLASYYIATIREIQPDGPYVLVGASSGGIIAFEMARQLEALHTAVILGMLDTAPPNSFRSDSRTYRELLGMLTADEALSGVSFETIAQMPDEDLVKFYYELNRKVGFLPDDWLLPDYQRLVDFMINHWHALTAWQAGRIKVPIYLFVASDEGDESVRDLHIWADYTVGGLYQIPVPGGHNTMYDPPYAMRVAEIIRQHLLPSTRSSDG